MSNDTPLEAKLFSQGAQQAAPVAVPPAQQPVAVKSHGAWDGLELLAEQPDGTELYAAQPAQPTQADMNAAIDRMRRENNLSIDGDNAYKRDLLDCVIGALAFGKQGSTPPPEDHWLHRFWEIGDAERKERDAAPPAQQSQAALKVLRDACEEALAWFESRTQGIAIDAKDTLRMALAEIERLDRADEKELSNG